MFDIGFWELTIIGIVALLVIGPDKLPGVARTAGRWLGRTRRFVDQVKSDIDREIRQEELRKALERDAGLDEIKEIMDTDRFTMADEVKPEHQVKAIDDDTGKEQAVTEPDAEEEDENTNDSGHGEYEPFEDVTAGTEHGSQSSTSEVKTHDGEK